MRRLSLLLLWWFALPLAAQQASHGCASVAEPAARLACYDEAFPPPPEVIEAATERAQADFGLNTPRGSLRNPGQTVEQADPERIESRVVRVDHDRGGQRSFALENGQVWAQTESRSGGHVQSGDVVQLRKGTLGSYQLVMPNGVVLRVRRVR
ncbi:type VI secretion protein [Luteimonas sp. BDR2-5]|nr:type VI secretion protein [Luteimonas sp. BDR2-5]